MIKYLRITLLTACLVLATQSSLFAQHIFQNKGFTYVPAFNNEAILLKEIPLKDISEAARNYEKLKLWIKNEYSYDMVNSSLIFDSDEQSALVKSKVDLLLPLMNANNMNEKAQMRYHLYTFIKNGKCILQISRMQYKLENVIPASRKRIPAENFVTDEALLVKDAYTKERKETQKGTLYYFNQLAETLEMALNGVVRTY